MKKFALFAASALIIASALLGCEGRPIGTFKCTDRGVTSEGEFYGFYPDSSTCDMDKFAYCLDLAGNQNILYISPKGKCEFHFEKKKRKKDEEPQSDREVLETIVKAVTSGWKPEAKKKLKEQLEKAVGEKKAAPKAEPEAQSELGPESNDPFVNDFDF